MKTEKQLIAIAEACGWRTYSGDTSRFHDHISNQPLFERENMTTPEGWDAHTVHDLPDYLGCLNAMHEAEKVLNHDQLLRYWGHLMNICGDRYRPILATAAQRAEAFLRTLGKWEESP